MRDLGWRPDVERLVPAVAPASVARLRRCSDEAIFRAPRSRPETEIRSNRPRIKQRGAIMLAIIFNAIYRELIRSSLSGAKVTGA